MPASPWVRRSRLPWVRRSVAMKNALFEFDSSCIREATSVAISEGSIQYALFLNKVCTVRNLPHGEGGGDSG